VVDGNWVTDHTAPQENDESGNLNNVLTTDRIVKHTPETVGIMNSVGPDSTTAGLAGKVAKEKAPIPEGSSDLPGAFPETPGLPDKEFSVNPLPAADGAVNPIKLAPGEKVPNSSDFTANTLTSGVHDDPELVAAAKAKSESEQNFSVSPLPAFAGAVNPVKVAPGEKLPESNTLTGNTIDSNVKLDKESYENSGALAPVLPPVVTPQAERDASGTGILDLPPISKNMIPESSLPMGTTGGYDASPFVQSGGAQSTTAQLAGAVPKESEKVPEVVKESQAKAGVDPEASGVPEEVKEKSAVEKELLKEVAVAPTTSEGTAGKDTPDKTEKGVTAGEAAAGVGAAALAVGAGVTAYASNAAGKLPESVTSKLPASVQNSINTNGTTPATTTAADTPTIVKESIAESGQSPEAAANEEAVLEKKAVEKELLKEIKPETSTGESAPTLAPATPAKPIESREVSPGTVPGSHVPAVTTGVASSSTTPVSTPSKATPSKGTPGSSTDSPTTAEKKKKNRNSIFSKLKAKFSDKDKKPKE
jgi:hypothetical protein